MLYRIKHLPTGLYFIPSRLIKIKTGYDSYDYQKSNLSKTGKVYTRKPSLAYLGDVFYGAGNLLPVNPSEWSIEQAS